MQIISANTQVSEKWMFSILSGIVVFALLAVFISNFSTRQGVYPQVSYLDNHAQNSSIERIHSLEQGWVPIANPISLGVTAQPHWFKFIIEPKDLASGKGLLEISYPLLDEVKVWLFDVNTRQALGEYSLGDTVAFSQRDLLLESFLVPIQMQSGPVQVYIQGQTIGALKLPILVWKTDHYLEYATQLNLFIGVCFGLLLAMGLSNLFFFLTTRDSLFFYYTAYVLSVALTLATLHGIGFRYFWPDHVWFQSRSVVFFASSTWLFAVIFSQRLLNLPLLLPRISKLFTLLYSLFIMTGILSFLVDYGPLITIFLSLVTGTVSVIMLVALWLTLKGITIAGYYSLAWILLLVSAFSASLDNLDIIQLPISSHYILIYGVTIEALLLAFIVAINYSRQRHEILAVKERALEEEQCAVRAEQALFKLQEMSQDDLEYKVQERTLELEIALRELSEVNRELEILNTIDPLTGIRNRRFFDKRLLAESRRSRREQTPLSIAMLDIDFFKRINDEFGHTAGDKCIKQVASLLQAALKRPSDDMCRYGGEEFAVILPSTDNNGATKLVEMMREEIQTHPVQYEGKDIAITVSAGVATAIIQYEGHEVELLKAADELLYQAKESGRNIIKNKNLVGQSE
jgi:diguanylate cyclase (GGDEF)-like protein